MPGKIQMTSIPADRITKNSHFIVSEDFDDKFAKIIQSEELPEKKFFFRNF